MPLSMGPALLNASISSVFCAKPPGSGDAAPGSRPAWASAPGAALRGRRARTRPALRVIGLDAAQTLAASAALPPTPAPHPRARSLPAGLDAERRRKKGPLTRASKRCRPVCLLVDPREARRTAAECHVEHPGPRNEPRTREPPGEINHVSPSRVLRASITRVVDQPWDAFEQIGHGRDDRRIIRVLVDENQPIAQHLGRHRCHRAGSHTGRVHRDYPMIQGPAFARGSIRCGP